MDSTQIYTISNGNWKDLKKAMENVVYDGATNLEVLKKITITKNTLFFTDGNRFPEDIQLNWQGEVFTINSNPFGNHDLLMSVAEDTGGSYINLDKIDNSEDAVALTKEFLTNDHNYGSSTLYTKLKEIKGNVSDFNDPIPNVLVEIPGTERKAQTDNHGNFSIPARINEVLKFTYPGREPVSSIVNNFNSLKITMPLGVEVLDEVVVEDKARLKELNAPLHENVTTNFGELDARKTGFAIKQIKGEQLNWSSRDITDAIIGKFPGVKVVMKYPEEIPYIALRGGEFSGLFAAWDLDGMLYPFDQPPLNIINIQNIKSITIMPGSWATARYGKMAIGGIVIVRTISQSIHQKTNGNNTSLYDRSLLRNNLYEEDAIARNIGASRTSKNMAEIEASKTLEGAYATYLSQRSLYDHLPSYFYDVSNLFIEQWNANDLANRILSNIEEVFYEDISALKTAAYKYEINGFLNNALDIYKRIYEVLPSSQATRDLANMYYKNGQVQNAWNIYREYLNVNDSLYTEGLDQIVKEEMLTILELHKDSLGLSDIETEVSKKEDITFLVEWNDPNAQFELQFVSPDNHYFIWNNVTDLPAKNSLKGYTSHSFKIEDIGKGPWIINAKYLGNQKGAPSFLKFTVRNNLKGSETIELLKLHVEKVNFRFLNVSADTVVSSLN